MQIMKMLVRQKFDKLVMNIELKYFLTYYNTSVNFYREIKIKQ